MPTKKIIGFAILGLFIILQVYLLFFKEIEVQDYAKYVNEHPLPLFGENREVCQEFRSPGTLARIDIMLANYLLKPKSGTLRLTIIDGERMLYLRNYPANTAEDNRFYSFPILKKTIPRGTYRLRLDYFRKDNNEKLAVWVCNKDLYPYGNLYVNGKLREGDMTFRVYYYSTIWKERARWLDSVPKAPARPYLLAAGFLLLLFMVNLLFYFLVKYLLQEKTDIHGTD
jgi:hypothetical protein